MDSSSLQGTTTNPLCFHILEHGFSLLKSLKNCDNLNHFLQAFMCHTLHNLVQYTFPIFGNVRHFILSMLTILTIIECTFKNTRDGGINFLPTSMFTKRIKFGSKEFFFIDNLCANLAPNMCDKLITQDTFCLR